MSSSTRFQLPYLDAAQAQKHVTVNESLARIDALAGGVAQSATEASPPAAPVEGAVHIVGTGGAGEWAGQDNSLAVFANGGWLFVAPWPGARMFDLAAGRDLRFDGAAWVAEDGLAGSPDGAATLSRVIEADHAVEAGGVSTVAAAIPDKAIVLGVTGRVTEAIGGAATWALGVTEDTTRFGSGIGVQLNAFAHGVGGTPLAYYGGTDLVLTAEGGSFSGGRVRLAIHLLEIAPTPPV